MKADGLASRPSIALGIPALGVLGRPLRAAGREGRSAVLPWLLAPFLKCLMNDFSRIIELYIDSGIHVLKSKLPLVCTRFGWLI